MRQPYYVYAEKRNEGGAVPEAEGKPEFLRAAGAGLLCPPGKAEREPTPPLAFRLTQASGTCGRGRTAARSTPSAS